MEIAHTKPPECVLKVIQIDVLQKYLIKLRDGNKTKKPGRKTLEEEIYTLVEDKLDKAPSLKEEFGLTGPIVGEYGDAWIQAKALAEYFAGVRGSFQSDLDRRILLVGAGVKSSTGGKVEAKKWKEWDEEFSDSIKGKWLGAYPYLGGITPILLTPRKRLLANWFLYVLREGAYTRTILNIYEKNKKLRATYYSSKGKKMDGPVKLWKDRYLHIDVFNKRHNSYFSFRGEFSHDVQTSEEMTISGVATSNNPNTYGKSAILWRPSSGEKHPELLEILENSKIATDLTEYSYCGYESLILEFLTFHKVIDSGAIHKSIDPDFAGLVEKMREDEDRDGFDIFIDQFGKINDWVSISRIEDKNSNMRLMRWKFDPDPVRKECRVTRISKYAEGNSKYSGHVTNQGERLWFELRGTHPKKYLLAKPGFSDGTLIYLMIGTTIYGQNETAVREILFPNKLLPKKLQGKNTFSISYQVFRDEVSLEDEIKLYLMPRRDSVLSFPIVKTNGKSRHQRQIGAMDYQGVYFCYIRSRYHKDGRTLFRWVLDVDSLGRCVLVKYYEDFEGENEEPIPKTYHYVGWAEASDRTVYITLEHRPKMDKAKSKSAENISDGDRSQSNSKRSPREPARFLFNKEPRTGKDGTKDDPNIICGQLFDCDLEGLGDCSTCIAIKQPIKDYRSLKPGLIEPGSPEYGKLSKRFANGYKQRFDNNFGKELNRIDEFFNKVGSGIFFKEYDIK